MSGHMPLPDNRSFYGDNRSNYASSFYGAMPDQRGSTYSLGTPQQPGYERRGSSYNLDGGNRVSSYNYPAVPPQTQMSQYIQPQAQSRPPSSFLPEVDASAPIALGEAGVTDKQLESSIRRICSTADLDNLTKKGVRKQLEGEYGVDLTARKDTINRIIERVLAGQSSSQPKPENAEADALLRISPPSSRPKRINTLARHSHDNNGHFDIDSAYAILM